MVTINPITIDLDGVEPVGTPAQVAALTDHLGRQNRFVHESWLPPRIVAGIPANGINETRALVAGALGLAVGFATNVLGGVDPDFLADRAVDAVDACATRHKVNAGPTGWGQDGFASPLASAQLGLAGWLVWSRLSVATRQAVEALVINEADVLHGFTTVDYLRDRDGQVRRVGPDGVNGQGQVDGDTGAEEESWRARGLSMALAMFSKHHNAVVWERGMLTRLIAAHAPPSLVNDQSPRLHNTPPCAWLAGSNLEEDGASWNHGYSPHPNYMRPVHHFGAYLQQALAGQPLSPSLTLNLQSMFSRLRALTDANGNPQAFIFTTDDIDTQGRRRRESPSPQVIFYANAVQHRALGFIGGAELEALHEPNFTHAPSGAIAGIVDAVHGDVASKLAEALLLSVVVGAGSAPVNRVMYGPDTDQGTFADGTPKVTFCDGLTVPGFGDTSGEQEAAARWAHSRGVMTGDGPTFRPRDGQDQISSVRTLWKIAGSPGGYPEHPYTDIDTSGTEYDRACRWAYHEGIYRGSGPASFAPFDQTTRGQAALMMWRERDRSEAPSAGFTDVSGEVERAANYFKAAGLTSAGRQFNPDQGMLRGDFVTFIYRLWAK